MAVTQRGEPSAPRRHSSTRFGVVGAVLVLTCLGLLVVLAMPPFLPADESAHVGYGLDVSDGRLPTVHTRVEPELPGQRSVRQHVANHPPLYHALVGPFLSWGVDSGHEIAGFRMARAASLVFSGVVVVLTAVVAGALARYRRAQVAVVAAGLVATLPVLVNVSAYVHNDALGLIGAVLAYAGAVRALTRRPTAGTVALVCLGSAVTMATRLSGVGMVALAAAGLGAAVLASSPGNLPRRLVRAALSVAAPLGVVAATSGWFYLRNHSLYGDYSGVAPLRETGGRVDAFSFWGFLTDPASYGDALVRVLNGGTGNDIAYLSAADRVALVAVLALALVGALWHMVGSRRWELAIAGGRPGRRTGEARNRVLVRRLGLVGLVVGAPLVLWLQVASFVDQTGAPHARYLLAAAPVVATAVASALLGLPGRVGAVSGLAAVAVQAAFTLVTVPRVIDDRVGLDGHGTFAMWREALHDADIAQPTLVLAVLLAGAVAGFGLQAWAVLAGDR